ncbi:MAG: hypothetical protein ACRC4M_02030, partial [Mycoplasma sp.]
MIRFKNSQREKVINSNFLLTQLPNYFQLINQQQNKYERCEVELTELFSQWKFYSNFKLSDLTSDGEYSLYIPNVCRYYTTGSNHKLKRGGLIELKFNDYEKYCFSYCLLNSSFVYWWWRIFDGGITLPKELLLSTPTFFDKLTNDDKKWFIDQAEKMFELEQTYKVIKNNVGIQENIKFPETLKNKNNNKILSILGYEDYLKKLLVIHNNEV